MNLITTDGCGPASDGDWYVQTSDGGGTFPYLALSLKLSEPLESGTEYTLSFDKRLCGEISSGIDIGIANDSTSFGSIIHSFDQPIESDWVSETYTFSPDASVKFITVNVGITESTGLIAVDNFSVVKGSTGITETKNAEIRVFPNPVSNILTIDMSSIPGKDAIQLADCTGKKVFTENIQTLSAYTIDMRSLPAGIYFLTLTGDHFESARIVKL